MLLLQSLQTYEQHSIQPIPGMNLILEGKTFSYPDSEQKEIATYTTDDGREVLIKQTMRYENATQINRIEWHYYIKTSLPSSVVYVAISFCSFVASTIYCKGRIQYLWRRLHFFNA